MLDFFKVDISALLISLSNALDLADNFLMKHQQKVAFIVLRMCEKGRIDILKGRDIFTAALFHDIGAFSLKEKKSLLTFEFGNYQSHCDRGYFLLKDYFWLTKVAAMVRYHHKPWKEWKKESKTLNFDIALGSQLINIADYADRLIKRDQCILHQRENILKEIKSLQKTEFHPYVVDLFSEVALTEEFWFTLTSPEISNVLLKQNFFGKEFLEVTFLVSISELFRNVIDFRSPFTATHSTGVSFAARKIAELMGFSPLELNMMQIAGNFHDVGKLGIPDRILEKPDKLSKYEFEFMKKHVYYTYSILSPVSGLGKISEWAGFHHERLNGTGYPFHLDGDRIDTGARILMVADFLTALIEQRPYKGKMARDEVEAILKDEVKKGSFDRNVVKVVLENYHQIHTFVSDAQKEMSELYKKRFASQ